MPNPVLTAGDTRPTRLTYREGKTPVNIFGYTITLVIGYPTKVTKTCTIIEDVQGANPGVFDIEWESTDLVAGTFPAEFIVTDTNATEKTHKIGMIEIQPRI